MADNFWFEERVDDRRRQHFEDGAAMGPSIAQLTTDHVGDHVETSGVPVTFTPANGLATYAALGEDQEIIRLESIQRALDLDGISFEEL